MNRETSLRLIESDEQGLTGKFECENKIRVIRKRLQNKYVEIVNSEERDYDYQEGIREGLMIAIVMINLELYENKTELSNNS